jgi:tetratricopeptide (TPR) repeat protein
MRRPLSNTKKLATVIQNTPRTIVVGGPCACGSESICDEAITKNPEHAADYCYRWGWVLTTQKRYQEVINLFEKAIHLSSSHETNDCLGVALDQQKRAVKAISTFKQAIIELNQDDFPTSHTVTAALWYRQCYEKWQKNRFVYEQMH